MVSPNNVNGFVRTVILISILSLLLATITGPAAALTENNTTSATDTPTATQTQTACDPGSSEPEMEQARLHASDQAIEPGSPGRISGGFQVSPTANCPVIVYITMSVPSGMTIAGGSDFTSGGAGMVSTKFTVSPNANIKDIAAEVYSDEVGQRTVTADIQYWPKGHQDMAREIDGLSFTFNVKEPTTPANSSQDDQSSGGFNVSNNMALIAALLLLIAFAIVGLVAR